MSDEPSFGDWEPADSIAAPCPADPLQVARRIHEDRGAVQMLAGHELPRWPELTDDERAVAIDLATRALAGLHDEPTAERGALTLHNAQRELTELAEWGLLDAGDQAVALDLMRLVVAWLELEGTTA